MIRLRIPETPNYFGNWLEAWLQMIDAPFDFVTGHRDKQGKRYFSASFGNCDIHCYYEMEAPDILWVTVDKYCRSLATEEDVAKVYRAIRNLAETADTRWPQPKMTYDEAFALIQEGEDKRKVKREFMKWHPNKSDDSFYSAMRHRRTSKNNTGK